jgi:DNA-binding IclR family transcriptional regulator
LQNLSSVDANTLTAAAVGPRHVAGVERAMAVLEALAAAEVDLGTNEIARRTGINASSVSRLLATLASGGLVRQVPDTGRYRLGLRLFQLGTAAVARLGLREIARPHLEALVAATGETATVSVAGEGEAITLDFVQSAASVRSVARVGRPSVGHATAVGKVLLAFGGASPGRSLHAYTARTITDPQVLDAELTRVAERGWAEAVGEREEDLNAIAAPVLDRRGDLAAILGVQGPASRFSGRALRAALDPLLHHAVSLTGELQ